MVQCQWFLEQAPRPKLLPEGHRCGCPELCMCSLCIWMDGLKANNTFPHLQRITKSCHLHLQCSSRKRRQTHTAIRIRISKQVLVSVSWWKVNDRNRYEREYLLQCQRKRVGTFHWSSSRGGLTRQGVLPPKAWSRITSRVMHGWHFKASCRQNAEAVECNMVQMNVYSVFYITGVKVKVKKLEICLQSFYFVLIVTVFCNHVLSLMCQLRAIICFFVFC